MKKHRLMQITHDLAIGGLQQVVVSICRTIDTDLFDVSVLCLRELGDFAPEIEALGIDVYQIPKIDNSTDYLAFIKVSKILKRLKIDIIHTHNTQPFVDGTIGGILSGCVKTIVHTDHARPFPDKKRYMFFEWLMSQFAYKVVGVSKSTTNNLLQYERISPSKVVTIPNGIDPSKYNILINKNLIKKEMGISEEANLIGLGVRLTQQKGIKYLLQATKILLEIHPNLYLIIAGEGPLEENLKSQALNLGIAKNVLFLGPRLDIPKILSILDIYVLPSVWEGLPMVILEAMAAGCPVVATKVGGIPEVINSNINGLLVEPRNVEQLVLAIDQLLSNDELRRKFSINSIDLIGLKYSDRTMTEKYEKLYLRRISE